MAHDTNDGVVANPRPRARRWLAAVVAPVSMLLVAGPMATASPGSALIPQPTTTTLPGRPTTTTTVVERPTTLPTPRETTTTTTTPRETTTTTTSPSTPATVPTAPPSSATGSTTGTTTATSPTTTSPQPIPEPPTSPPTSEPETAGFVMSNPVVVDPMDPIAHPPVVVAVSATCPDISELVVTVTNIDSYHYPDPFTATYEWTIADGAAIVESGTVELPAWEDGWIHVEGLAAGTYTVTIADVDLGVATSAEVVIPDCGNLPAPSPDPLPPLVIVPAVMCAAFGGGRFDFTIQNPTGDDGSIRHYDFAVLWTDAQTEVDAGATGDVGDAQTASREVYPLEAGTYIVTVTDAAMPALTVSVAVEVPECPEPQLSNEAPLVPPSFVYVITDCADPALDDGSATFVIYNEFLHLGGSGMLAYEWTVTQGSSLIEAVNSILLPGLNYWPTQSLAPGEYAATFTLTSFPDVGDTVAFTVDDCAMPQPVDPAPVVHDVMTACIDDDDTATLMFFVEHHAPTVAFSWSVSDGQVEVASAAPVWWYADGPNLTVIRHLPVGSFQFTITNLDDPSITASTTIDIGSCVDPPDPTDPPDPVDPVDPADAADAFDPADAVDPVATTDPTHPASSSPPTDADGTLPPTALSGALPATR